MSTRTYGQHCGLAAALDLLGERWTLLIVRELVLGPKRFRDLDDGLPGLGTNLLSARLRSLEAAGVVTRTLLPPPAGVRVYELTQRGRRLEPMIEDLALWGFDLLPEAPVGTIARASWIALSMRAAGHRGLGPKAPDGTIALDVSGELLALTTSDGRLDVRHGRPPTAPDTSLTTDVPTFYALASHALSPARALRERRITLDGNRDHLERVLAAFPAPARVAA